MSNQEPQNPNKTTEEAAVEHRRRFIKGAGAVAPVILTLTSSSVFGQELCLSQQLSGNDSQHPPGTGSCVLGYTPTYLKDPAKINLWQTAGFVYGTRITTPPNNGTLCTHYSGGTAFNAAIAFGPGPGCITPAPSQPMRQLMCGASGSAQAIWAAAMVNSGLNTAHVLNYILTREQVLALWNGTCAPPVGFNNDCAGKLLFLKKTMGL